MMIVSAIFTGPTLCVQYNTGAVQITEKKGKTLSANDSLRWKMELSILRQL